MTRNEWIESRKRGIGGSEAAALFGVHPWTSPFALYQEKIGAVNDDRDSPAMRWGRRLEPVVRDAYAEEVGRVVTVGVTNRAHPRIPFMLANTDGTIGPIPDFDGPGVYEGKMTLSPHNKAQWDVGVPLFYQVQTQHYMAVLGLEWAGVACFIPGVYDPLLYCDIPRNQRFIDALEEREHRFWHDHILAGVAPDPDGSMATTNALKLLHPKDNGEIITLPEESAMWARRVERSNAAMKRLKGVKDEFSNKLRAAMGPATYGILPDSTGYSYKHQSRAAFSVKANETRVLRRSSAKAIVKAQKALNEAADAALADAGLDTIGL